MGQSKIFKIFIFLLLIALFIFVFLSISNCHKGENIPETKKTENINEAETTAMSSDTFSETSNENSSSETTPIETTTSSQTENSNGEVKKDVIILEGNNINDNSGIIKVDSGIIRVEINLKTGEVWGFLQMGLSEFSLEGNTTKICEYILNCTIKGTLDFETFKIEGILSGKATTDTKNCPDYDISYKMHANILKDYSNLRGYFETDTNEKYEFFLKIKN